MAMQYTYDDGTRIEDVMADIIMVSPTDTPFMSGIGKTHAYATLHEWIRDSLSTRADNAVAEGATFSFSARTAPTRSVNVVQMQDKEFDVSSTEQWVKKYHKQNDESARQLKNAMKELATDIEHALLKGSKSSGTGSAARRMAGALNYISTNTTAVASGTKLTESFYNGLLSLCWTAGGNPDETYVNSFMKRVISSYTAGTTKNREQGGKKLVNTVDIYESDFGVQKIILCRDIPTGDNGCAVLIIENSRFNMAIGEPVHELSAEEVAQTSHSKKRVLRGEHTLEVLAEETCATATSLDDAFVA